jgi:anti-sigma B factor antagonist
VPVLTTDPPFAVDHRRFGERAVVSVSGELDIATAPQLAAVLALALGARPAALWVDLTRTTFIDSTGLNVLCAASDRCDGRLTVICPPRVRRVFEIAGLAGVVTLHDGPAGVDSIESRSRDDSTRVV